MITLELPYPPSVNRYYRHVGFRTLISREVRASINQLIDEHAPSPEADEVDEPVKTVTRKGNAYQMTSGSICRDDHFLNRVCYEVGVKELIRDGYLSPLRTKAGIVRADTGEAAA